MHSRPDHPIPIDTLLGDHPAAALPDDEALLPEIVTAVRAAGEIMRDRFSPDSRPGNREEMVAAIHANDEASLAVLREPLEKARPGAGWVEDELEGGALPPGEWWVTDPLEGNVNHVHGMTDWCVTATLVRDNEPALTAIYLPLTGVMYTALRGGGAYEDGMRLRPSAKTGLDGALVGTGQARPGENEETHHRIGLSAIAMLEKALVVRVSVPATLPLVHVAAGRMDAFWQYSRVRSGLVSGALLVAEAGGTVTDVCGEPWSVTSEDFLAAAPALHPVAVDVLSTVR